MVLRGRISSVAGVVMALCLGAAACTPTGPSTPSPSPTATSASPTETELERQTRLDFEAAEKAYREFSAEYDRLSNQGGAQQPSSRLTMNGDGPLLEAARQALREQLSKKERTTGAVSLVWVRHGSYAPDSLELQTCADGSAVRIIDAGGKVIGRGSIGTSTVQVRKAGNRWKAFDLKDDRNVASCDG